MKKRSQPSRSKPLATKDFTPEPPKLLEALDKLTEAVKSLNLTIEKETKSYGQESESASIEGSSSSPAPGE